MAGTLKTSGTIIHDFVASGYDVERSDLDATSPWTTITFYANGYAWCDTVEKLVVRIPGKLLNVTTTMGAVRPVPY